MQKKTWAKLIIAVLLITGLVAVLLNAVAIYLKLTVL